MDVDALIAGLEHNLINSNMKAITQAEQLRQQLSHQPGLQALAGELVQATENLDFDKARQTLRDIKEKADVEKHA